LQQIAYTLGVEVDALLENQARHLIHTADDGTRWFLAVSAEGGPVVRTVASNSGDLSGADEAVIQFLVRHFQSPQGQALETLINHLLLASLR
jgi:hypothetical protein